MMLAGIATLLALAVSGVHVKEAVAPRCTLSLDAGEREDRALGADTLRDAIAEASGCEVARERRAATVLRVRVVGERVRLELRVHGRETLVRIVALDTDPHERTQAIVIVAAHMLRNEADELLGLLGRHSGGATTATEEQTSTDPVDAITSESPADAITSEPSDQAITSDPPDDAITSEPSDQAFTSEPSAEAITSEPSAEAITSEVSADAITREVDAPGAVDANVEGSHERGPPIVRLGLTGLVSSVPSGAGVEATVIGGLEVAATPTPWLALGVRDLLGGVPLGAVPSWSFGGGAFAELSLRVIEWLAIEGQLGADVRGISVGDRGSTGVAPFVIVGARAFLAPEVSLALESGLHVVASELWSTTTHLVPRGAVVWSGGLALGVHL